jgi:hypothetical protein
VYRWSLQHHRPPLKQEGVTALRMIATTCTS